MNRHGFFHDVQAPRESEARGNQIGDKEGIGDGRKGEKSSDTERK